MMELIGKTRWKGWWNYLVKLGGMMELIGKTKRDDGIQKAGTGDPHGLVV